MITGIPLRIVLLVALMASPAEVAGQQPDVRERDAATPYLAVLRDRVLYGDVWERPQLSRRDRSLLTIAVTQALQTTDQLREHLHLGLDHGLTQVEIAELIAHVGVYAGVPRGLSAARVAAEVYADRGLPVRPPGVSPRRAVDRGGLGPGVDVPASPYLEELVTSVVYAELWERPGLPQRDRSLVSLAVTQAQYATDEVRALVARGLDSGLTQEEISEAITHVAFYSGLPTAVNAAAAAAAVFEERGLPRGAGRFPGSPYLAPLIDDLTFGEVWERPQLAPRDRSLITMAVAQTLYASDQMRVHVGRALDNGVTPEEIAEVLAHLSLYAGFPRAENAAAVAAQVFESRGIAPPGR